MAVIKSFEVWYVKKLVADDVLQENFRREADKQLDREQYVTVKGLFKPELAFFCSLLVPLEAKKNKCSRIGFSDKIVNILTTRRPKLTLIYFMRFSWQHANENGTDSVNNIGFVFICINMAVVDRAKSTEMPLKRDTMAKTKILVWNVRMWMRL